MPIFVILIIFHFRFICITKSNISAANGRWSANGLVQNQALRLAHLYFLCDQSIFIHRSTVSLIVGIVFLFVGAGSIWGGYRAHRYYFPLAVKEAEETK